MSNARTSTRHIGLLLFDDVEELDAVGPWEVLSYWTLHHPEDGWSISCVSRDGAPVVAAKGLTLADHRSMSGMPPLEVLIHPGGQGTRPLMRDPEHLAWVQTQAATVPLMTSVCTGALVYAAAGLLAGRPATTHWESLDLLHELDPSIEVNSEARYVDDGKTSSPAPGSAPASIWRCTWSLGSPVSTGPGRSAEPSSTTPTPRSEERPYPVPTLPRSTVS